MPLEEGQDREETRCSLEGLVFQRDLLNARAGVEWPLNVFQELSDERRRKRKNASQKTLGPFLIMRIDYGRKSVMTRPPDARAYFPSDSTKANLDERFTIVARTSLAQIRRSFSNTQPEELFDHALSYVSLITIANDHVVHSRFNNPFYWPKTHSLSCHLASGRKL